MESGVSWGLHGKFFTPCLSLSARNVLPAFAFLRMDEHYDTAVCLI